MSWALRQISLAFAVWKNQQPSNSKTKRLVKALAKPDYP